MLLVETAFTLIVSAETGQADDNSVGASESEWETAEGDVSKPTARQWPRNVPAGTLESGLFAQRANMTLGDPAVASRGKKRKQKKKQAGPRKRAAVEAKPKRVPTFPPAPSTADLTAAFEEKPSLTLSDQMTHVERESECSFAEQVERDRIRVRVEQLLGGLFRGCRVLPIGSSTNTVRNSPNVEELTLFLRKLKANLPVAVGSA